MKHISRLSAHTWLEHMRRACSSPSGYYAMYSSVVNGITIDPAAMVVPVDDHLVHRGDGVFESMKCVNGAIYNVDSHLDRLEKAYTAIKLDCPYSREELLDIVSQTIHAGGRRDCLIRILLSRGTGTMSIDPGLCRRPELYVVVYPLGDKQQRKTRFPVKVGISRVPMKPPFFATIKSCNYLPNVLMKAEAAERDLDYVVAIDERGNLGEGATESFAIVTSDRQLLSPPAERVLIGTTLQRVIELAQRLVESGELKFAGYKDITPFDAQTGSEMLVIGTTRDVLPVCELEGKKIGSGEPGPIYKQLVRLLKKDICANEDMRYVVYKQG
jgi:branched-subunit amino acid aminotransferase/4-amino-4-deoxychorismate lyase